MPTFNHLILTSAQRTAAMKLNNDDIGVNPRAVDGTSPGTGSNLNAQATRYALADPVTLSGMFVCPSAILTDPQALEYNPDLVAYLRDKPFAALGTDQVFAPSPGPDA
jgi:hypothetical protein